MKKFFPFLIPIAAAILLVLGATAPVPIQRNLFSTNVAGQPLLGTFTYSNASITATQFLIVDNTGLASMAPGNRVLWKGYGWNNGGKAFDWANGLGVLWTNGCFSNVVVNAGVSPIILTGVAGQTADYASILDSAGNRIGYFNSTNQMWWTTNDFYFSGTITVDGTATFTFPTLSSATASFDYHAQFFNSTNCGSVWRTGAFRRVVNTSTQVEGTILHRVSNVGTYDCTPSSGGLSGIILTFVNTTAPTPNVKVKVYGTIKYGN